MIFVAAFALVMAMVWLTLTVRAERVRGRLEERLRQVTDEIERKRKQAAIVAENRTVDDAAKRLDDGSF